MEIKRLNIKWIDKENFIYTDKEWKEFSYKWIDGGKYFSNRGGQANDLIFDRAVGNKEQKRQFTQEVLGYCEGGDFPVCYSLEDATKLVNALRKEYPCSITSCIVEDEDDEIKLDFCI